MREAVVAVLIEKKKGINGEPTRPLIRREFRQWAKMVSYSNVQMGDLERLR